MGNIFSNTPTRLKCFGKIIRPCCTESASSGAILVLAFKTDPPLYTIGRTLDSEDAWNQKTIRPNSTAEKWKHGSTAGLSKLFREPIGPWTITKTSLIWWLKSKAAQLWPSLLSLRTSYLSPTGACPGPQCSQRGFCWWAARKLEAIGHFRRLVD